MDMFDEKSEERIQNEVSQALQKVDRQPIFELGHKSENIFEIYHLLSSVILNIILLNFY